MTNAGAARYFKEALGEPDPSNPEIQPLHQKKAQADALGDYYMPEMIDFYIKAVIDLWTEQATSALNGIWPGAETSPCKLARPFMEAYKWRIGMLTNAFKTTSHTYCITYHVSHIASCINLYLTSSHLLLGGLTTSAKFRGLRIMEGYNAQGFKHMMKSFWTCNYVQLDQKSHRKLNGLRDHLNLSWTHFMMCRGENMWMALLQDLNFHVFEFSDATGQFTLGIVLTMLQGKMNADGKLLYGVVV